MDQVRSITIVTIAVARGDLTQKIENQVKSVIPTLEGTSSLSFWESNLGINICTPRYRKPTVDQLAPEVTRVALEVSMQGIVGEGRGSSRW
jgi:hypothetical protein